MATSTNWLLLALAPNLLEVPCSYLCEAKIWAKYSKVGGEQQTKIAIGPACAECWLAVKRAFPLSNWTSVCTKAKISEEHRQQLQEAIQSHKLLCADKEPKFPRQSVESEHVAGYLLERPCLFLTESEYLAKFGIEPKFVAGLKVAEVLDVTGELIRGVTMLNPEQPYRTLRLMSSTNAVMRERAQAPEQQLRSMQGQEMCDHLRSSIVKETKGLFAPVSLEALRLQAEEAKKKKEEAAARATLETPVEPEMSLMQEDQQEQSAPAAGILGQADVERVEDSDHEADGAHSIGLGVLRGSGKTSLLSRRAKADSKPKAKAKAKSKREPKQRGQFKLSPKAKSKARSGLPCPSVASACDGEASAISGAKGRGLDAASLGDAQTERAVKARKTPATSVHPSEQSNSSKEQVIVTNGWRWLKDCRLSKFLTGAAMGNEKYQLKRAKQALEALNPHSADYLALAAHLDKIRDAEALQAQNIGKLSKETRCKLIAELETEEVVWPSDVKVALLTCAVREWQAGSGSAEALWDIVNPHVARPQADAGEMEDTDGFEPLNPRLKDALLDDINLAKVFTRLILTETVIPLLLQGQSKMEQLQEVISEALAADIVQGGPVTTAMTREVVTCLLALRALGSQEVARPEDMAALDTVMAAKDPTKNLVREAVRQNSHYRALEAELRRTQVAQSTFGPRVRDTYDKLSASLEEKNVSTDFLEECFAHIQEWREALRAAATQKLEEKMVEAVELLQEMRSADIELLEELVRLMAGGIQKFCSSSEVMVSVTRGLLVESQCTCVGKTKKLA